MPAGKKITAENCFIKITEMFIKRESVMISDSVRGLFSFISSSPTGFHTVETMRSLLLSEGYTQLSEGSEWVLEPKGKYFVIRNGSALIAFRLPVLPARGFQIIASHDDSPAFKLKNDPEMECDGHYVKLNVEKYGSMLCAPWFDRPLSVAGRIQVKRDNCIESLLVDAKRPMLIIPNLAIHMNRGVNEGVSYNIQKDLLPLYGDETAKGTFMSEIAVLAGVSAEDILAHDLFLYPAMSGTVWGAGDAYISAPRLDDLECAYASLRGFLTASSGTSVPVHCVYDNEEVGSGTRQGAASTFLSDVLHRICESASPALPSYRQMLCNSFMLSADNAHAVHPNNPEKACPGSRPYMNKGIVLKFSANQKYCTDALSASVVTEICRAAGVPVQIFHNRSDMPGGSTLGNISSSQVPIMTADIGLPQLAMHSPYETAGAADLDYLIKAAAYFYESAVEEKEYGKYFISHA